MVSYEEVVEFLTNSSAYTEGGPVEHRRTHISDVFLTSRYAYKLRKPVRFDFLDFSTREARYRDCLREVRLNRRLAEDVYLDVLPITESHGFLQLGGSGRPGDWVVQMRRLPDEATLQARIETNEATTADIDQLLAVLVPFFRKAPTGGAIDQCGYVWVVRRNVLENFEVIEGQTKKGKLSGSLMRRLKSAQLQFLSVQASIFEKRIAEGWIRDGHGDLRADHIYLTDPLRIVDCIEFNDEFRYNDVLDEICFLATDLHRLGRDDLGDYLLEAYRREMKDPAPNELAACFRAYRNSVRAKVACLTAENQEGTAQEKSLQIAQNHLEAAWEALELYHRPWLIVLLGVTGMGKSTLAIPLAEEIGASRLDSDLIRKELHGLSTTDRGSNKQLYSAESTRNTYNELADRARASLEEGASVVVEATFQHRADRGLIGKIGKELAVPVLFVECYCPEDVARARIQERQKRNLDPSDADLEIFKKQVKQFEPLDEVASDELIRVDTERPMEELVSQIVSRLRLV